MSKKKNLGVPLAKASGRSTASKSSPKKAPGFPPPPYREWRAPKTKAQRHALYRAMLKVVSKDDNYAGFCQLLAHAFDLYEPGYDDGVRSLPELHKHNPGVDGVYHSWFKQFDWEPRIRALKAAIKASAPASRPLPTRDSDRSGKPAAKRGLGTKSAGRKASPKPTKKKLIP